MLVIFIILLLPIAINNVLSAVPYEVPEPKVEVFKRGFRVSIPHEEGVELFAFHGNANEEMKGIEAGYFSKDIVKKCGDNWVFEEHSKKLVVGDKLYFWLFVIRNRLGYRYDDGHFIVKEISEKTPLNCTKLMMEHSKQHSESSWINQPERSGEHNPIFDVRSTSGSGYATIRTPNANEELSVCCDLFLNVSYRIISVAEQNQKLIDENVILSTLIEKDEYLSKTLKLFGKYPTKYYPTPQQFAQNIIQEKLQLNDVVVTEGKTIPDNGISFKVEKLSDKVRVILAAKLGLEGSNYELSW